MYARTYKELFRSYIKYTILMNNMFISNYDYIKWVEDD
jgi:hypothetical protein